MVKEFKKGPFHLAVKSGVKYITPCFVFGAHKLWSKSLCPKAGNILVKFLDRIETKNKSIEQLSSLLHSSFLSQQREFLKNPPPFVAEKSSFSHHLPAICWLAFLTLFLASLFF